MTKKTKIYIGVGAGILLLGYLYLKRKQNQAVKMLEEQQGEVLEEGVEERGVAPSGGGGGGSFATTTPIATPSLFAPLTALVTPVAVATTPVSTATTPSIRDVTNLGTGITIPSLGSGAGGRPLPPTHSLNPTATIKPTFSSANIGKPTTSPIASLTISKPALTSPSTSFNTPRPAPTVSSVVVPRPTATVVAPTRLAFDGTNNECFETGHCLTDL